MGKGSKTKRIVGAEAYKRDKVRFDAGRSSIDPDALRSILPGIYNDQKSSIDYSEIKPNV